MSGDIRQYAFRHLSLTVHFGFTNDPLKPQVFRSEWSGIRDWTGAGPGFQSPGAGHPHWQFDLATALQLDSRETLDLVFDDSGDDTVEDFATIASDQNVLRLVQSTTIERMHFASAAPWWRRQASDDQPLHMNAPEDQESLSRWLLACIVYLKQELARCEIRGR
ncbi:MAG TPA: hypothetical protein VGX95_04775 [Xanthobacteraceae bacterium]|jgi:hypothetical protein|nr:hypothetical protein [Xanthobacteraceae bacterium]